MKVQTFPFLTVNIVLLLLFLCGSAVSVGMLDVKSKGLFHALDSGLWTLDSGSCYFLRQESLSVPLM